MNIVNLLHIGDEVRNMDDLSPEEKREIALKLNIQALTPLGYVLRTEKNKDEKDIERKLQNLEQQEEQA